MNDINPIDDYEIELNEKLERICKAVEFELILMNPHNDLRAFLAKIEQEDEDFIYLSRSINEKLKENIVDVQFSIFEIYESLSKRLELSRD